MDHQDIKESLVITVLVGYIPWYPHGILSACFGGQGNVPLSHKRAAKFDFTMMMMSVMMII